jgi:hypothetical protein
MERGSTIMIRCISVLLEGKEMMGKGIFLVRLGRSMWLCGLLRLSVQASRSRWNLTNEQDYQEKMPKSLEDDLIQAQPYISST